MRGRMVAPTSYPLAVSQAPRQRHDACSASPGEISPGAASHRCAPTFAAHTVKASPSGGLRPALTSSLASVSLPCDAGSGGNFAPAFAPGGGAPLRPRRAHTALARYSVLYFTPMKRTIKRDSTGLAPSLPSLPRRGTGGGKLPFTSCDQCA